jgi:tetratricopeptide (TPR) repeat protein
MSKRKQPNKRTKPTSKNTQRKKVNTRTQKPKTKAKTSKSNGTTTSIPNYWYWLGAILLVTFIAYSSSLNNSFVNWDDDSNIVNNPYVQNFDVVKIFSETYSNAYRPLTFLTFSAIYQAAGANAQPYHILSLLFHLFNVVLVFQIFKMLLAQYKEREAEMMSLIIAGLFAIHPMAVEAVSWASALNDVMYVSFFLGGVWMYLKERKAIWIYLLFVLSLFTKPSAIVFPFVLLLIDWYRSGKLERKDWISKLPLVGIAVIFAVVSVLARNNSEEVSELATTYSFLDRILFAFYSFGFYAAKLFAPLNLSAIHYFPEKTGGTLPTLYYLAPILSILVVAALFVMKKHRQALIFGIGFYVLNLILVSQIIPFGRAVVAERYAYLPYLGLFFLIAYGYSLLSKNFKTYANYGLIGVGLLLALMTYNRSMVWKDGMSLFTDIIDHYPNSAMSYYNLANEYNRQGDYQTALETFDKAITINDKSASFYNNKANTYTLLNQHENAIPLYDKAISLEPNTANFYFNKGMALKTLNDLDNAVVNWQKALELKEDYERPHLQLGDYYFNNKKYNDARRHYTRSIELNYEKPYAMFYLGSAEFNLGSKEEGCRILNEAHKLGYPRAIEMITQFCK